MTSYESITQFYLSKLRMMVLADPDMNSVTLLAEKYVQQKPQFDCIVVIGPFIHNTFETPEVKAIAQADMAAIIAQLENIVCRVIYLSSESDSVEVLINQLHLTPNSVNIHSRKMSLARNLNISGFSEDSNAINIMDIETMEEYDEDDIENMKTSSNMIKISTASVIEEILLSRFSYDQNFDDRTLHKSKETIATELLSSSSLQQEISIETMGSSYNIFVFNFKYSHSLSYFLFHMNHIIEQAKVKLCIIPAIGDSMSDALRLPREFGSLQIVVPKSLRLHGEYYSITLHSSHDSSQSWAVDTIEALML